MLHGRRMKNTQYDATDNGVDGRHRPHPKRLQPMPLKQQQRLLQPQVIHSYEAIVIVIIEKETKKRNVFCVCVRESHNDNASKKFP